MTHDPTERVAELLRLHAKAAATAERLALRLAQAEREIAQIEHEILGWTTTSRPAPVEHGETVFRAALDFSDGADG